MYIVKLLNFTPEMARLGLSVDVMLSVQNTWKLVMENFGHTAENMVLMYSYAKSFISNFAIWQYIMQIFLYLKVNKQ